LVRYGSAGTRPYGSKLSKLYRRLGLYDGAKGAYHRDSNPYKILSNLKRKLRPRYRGGGGSDRRRYTLDHSSLYKGNFKDNYKPIKEPKQNLPRWMPEKTGAEYKIDRPDYKPEQDAEELLKELEKRFDEKLEDRLLEILEKEFEISRAESLRNQEISEYAEDAEVREKIGSESDTSVEKEGEYLEIDPEGILKPEAANEDNKTESELEQVDDLSSEYAEQELEITDDMIDRPPEEALEPANSIEAISEAVIEDPVLSYDLEPAMWSDIELLINDLEPERLEPEHENIESGT